MSTETNYLRLVERAKAGDVQASLACAGYELVGKNVGRSVERAVERTHAAAAAEDAAALRIAASYDLIRPDRSTTLTAALSMLRRAATKGDGVAVEILPCAESTDAFPDQVAEPEVLCASPYIAFWPAFLNRVACAYLIATARERLRRSDVVDSASGKQMESEMRLSETAWWRPWQMDIVLHETFRKAVEAFGGTIDRAEPLNVVRYQPGGIFFAHLDAYKSYETQQLDDTARATTSIVYLNDGYEGGETAFIEPRLKIAGLAGDMLHFRNLTSDGEVDLSSVHAGMPVTAGEKWVLVQWVRRR